MFISSCTDVLHKPLILINSHCCFPKDGKEMYQHVKRTYSACGVIVFAHETDCFMTFSLPFPSSLLKLPII